MAKEIIIPEQLTETLEVSVISQIILDELKDQFYNISNGIIDTYERIGIVATDFYNQHKHITEWEEFIDSDNNPFKNTTTDWSDYIIAWARHNYIK